MPARPENRRPRIAVLGVGGIGGYYAGLLARAGHDVFALARGANLAALRDRGLVVRASGEEWKSAITVSDDASELSRSFEADDVVLVTTKAYSLDGIAPAARRFAERDALVVPFLNGVSAAERLSELGVPRKQLIGGVTYISAVRVEPGIFERRSTFQRVIVGELPNGISPRAKKIATMFADAGAEATASEDITLALWQKFVFLASIAAACGLTRLPIGPVRDTPLGARLIERAVREAVAVGRARRVALAQDEEARVLNQINSLPASMHPSLLLDLQAGSPTEVDVLSGAIARFAEEGGIETPIHDAAAIALAQRSAK
ncbi:MAG: ketopantoate reductase family protein [Gemmatimonadaceae bacterium]